MAYSIDSSTDNCYEGTSVLINKLNIRDEQELSDIEMIITAAKIKLLLDADYDGVIDAQYYCGLHKEIFGDIYEWAGSYRTADLSKKGTRFHKADDLERATEKLFDRLVSCEYFTHDSKEEYVSDIAEFYSDLNLLHPFREGNGRTQRVLMTKLIERAGYSIDFAKCDRDLLMIATIRAAQGVMDLLIEFFKNEID